MNKHLTRSTLVLALVSSCSHFATEGPIVIAHRGASGHLPEHTIAAYALAYGQGAQFIEPDVVLSSDGVAFALHDITLERTTNVGDVFPARHRSDGSYYVMDFSAVELDSLTVVERTAGRFAGGSFSLPRFEHVIDLVAGLNAVNGCRVGIYPELKDPVAHHEAGLDLATTVLDLLAAKGFGARTDPVFLQSFDAGELKRVRHDLGSDLTLIQLMRGRALEGYDRGALEEIASYADGVGVFKTLALKKGPIWVDAARRMGLAVHVFTARTDRLAEGYTSFAAEIADLRRLGVDGIFADHPSAALAALGRPIDPVCGRR